jgi:hypothetical protein
MRRLRRLLRSLGTLPLVLDATEWASKLEVCFFGTRFSGRTAYQSAQT